MRSWLLDHEWSVGTGGEEKEEIAVFVAAILVTQSYFSGNYTYSGGTKEVYECSDPKIFIILGHGSCRMVHWICLFELYDVKFL